MKTKKISRRQRASIACVCATCLIVVIVFCFFNLNQPLASSENVSSVTEQAYNESNTSANDNNNIDESTNNSEDTSQNISESKASTSESHESENSSSNEVNSKNSSENKKVSSANEKSSNNASENSNYRENNNENDVVQNESNEIKVTVSVTGGTYGNVSGGGDFTLSIGATAYDALMCCGLNVNASNTQYGIYVSSIGGLAEKEHGATSGWLYSVNGIVPSTACSNYKLKDGDVVKWYYSA